MATEEPAPAPGEERSVALALVNTRVSGTRGVFDRLSEAAELDRWLQRRDLLGTAEASATERSDVLRLRDDARAVLAALELGGAPARPVLDRVNAAASEPVRPVLDVHGSGPVMRWESAARERPITRIARDLILFAVSAEAARLRTCAADDCDRMFVQDHGRRIWCSSSCGNRMRVQRHAARARAASRPVGR